MNIYDISQEVFHCQVFPDDPVPQKELICSMEDGDLYNLTGFSNAIEAVFPKADIQNCIIHQLRNSGKYVSYKDLKALMTDLKQVYAAVDEPAAEEALDRFAERWDRKYPKISASWRANWPNLSTYFKFPEELRRLIYTTNAIEGFNRQLRKVTKLFIKILTGYLFY